MKLPIALSTYTRDAGRLPALPLRNLIVEKTPADDEGVILLPRPGLSTWRTVSGGSDVKAVFSEPGVLSGQDVALCGSSVVIGGSVIGTMAAQATQAARFAGSSLELAFCNGGTLYRTDGTTLSEPTFPDGAQVISVGIMDSYFLAIRGGSARIYWSAINDATSWPALNFASAESRPDNLLDVIVVNDQLALIGQESIEFWQANPTGDQTLPFTRIDGLTFAKGALNTGAAIYADNTLIWIGDDGVAYRRGPVPMRISDGGIEEQIAGSSAAYLSLFNWTGHAVLMVTLDAQTLFYDFQTRLWSEASSAGYDGWRPWGCATNGLTPLFADRGAPAILKLDETQLYDVDAAIERRFTALLPSDQIIDNLWLDAQAGIGVEPGGGAIIVENRSSTDGGQTFTPWYQADLGRRGEYRKRAEWRRLGRFDYPGGVLEFRCSDPAPFSVQSVRINEPLSGRSA